MEKRNIQERSVLSIDYHRAFSGMLESFKALMRTRVQGLCRGKWWRVVGSRGLWWSGRKNGGRWVAGWRETRVVYSAFESGLVTGKVFV
nr:hypothetical protein [Tanacetum cinerariifolium]